MVHEEQHIHTIYKNGKDYGYNVVNYCSEVQRKSTRLQVSIWSHSLRINEIILCVFVERGDSVGIYYSIYSKVHMKEFVILGWEWEYFLHLEGVKLIILENSSTVKCQGGFVENESACEQRFKNEKYVLMLFTYLENVTTVFGKLQSIIVKLQPIYW